VCFLHNSGKNPLKGQEVPLNSSLQNTAKIKQPITITDVFFMPYAFQNPQLAVRNSKLIPSNFLGLHRGIAIKQFLFTQWFL